MGAMPAPWRLCSHATDMNLPDPNPLHDPAAGHADVDLGDEHPAPAPLAPAPGEPMPRLFFITGAQKSGTTWATRMLTRHPQVHCFGESVLFGLGSSPGTPGAWIDRRAIETWMSRPFSARMNEHGIGAIERAARRGVVEALLRLYHRPGVRALGERTPHFTLLGVEHLHELFPEAVVVEVLRDGRDATVSYVYHLLRHGLGCLLWDDPDDARRAEAWHIRAEGVEVPLLTERAVRDGATRWRLAIEAGRRARTLFGDALVTLRYEQLLDDPARIRVVFDALGVEHDAVLLARCVESESFKARSGRDPGEPDPASFWRAGVAGGWREHFSEADLALYRSIAGPQLDSLGYA